MYTTKNRRRSVFWRVGLFKRISRNSANCLLCPQTIATPNSSTTGLKTHLMRRHSDYAHFLEHVKDDPNLWLNIAEQTEHIQKMAKQSEEEGEGEKKKQCHQIIKRERHNSTDDEEQQRPLMAERARGEEAKERQRIHQKQQMKREQRDDITEQQQQQMVNRDQKQQQKAGLKMPKICNSKIDYALIDGMDLNSLSAFTALRFEQNQHQQGEQQQYFVDRKGIRWEFLASAFIYREMIAIAAFHGFVRTTWNTKCKRWWFKCKFNTAHFKCSCRATWLSSRKALFTTGLHNHPVKMDSENGPSDTVDKHPPAQFEQKGNYWYLFADGIRSGNALSKFCSANGLVQDGKSPNDLRVYLRCRSVAVGCRFRALYMRQLGAVYRRSVGHRHSLNVGKREQQSESADSKCRLTDLSAVCSKNITTSSFTHTSAVISQIHPPPLLKSKSGIWWELSVVLPPSCSVNVAKLALPLRYVNESVAGRVYYKCTNSKNCKKTGVFLRSIRALYTRGVHTCPSLANDLTSPKDIRYE